MLVSRGIACPHVPESRLTAVHAHLLLLKREDRRSRVPSIAPRRGEDEAFSRIRCPICSWTPTLSSRWACHGPDPADPSFAGCGAIWNTFATRGVCPGCAHRWRWTKCLSCVSWSLHDDWYEAG